MRLDAQKSKYVVDAGCTIEDAWEKIEVNRHRSVIVVEGKKVVGTLSDGDIRKVVLDKHLLSTPVHGVMNTNFTSLRAEERARAAKIFVEKDIFIIPVVDAQMRLLDVLVR